MEQKKEVVMRVVVAVVVVVDRIWRLVYWAR